MHAASPLPVRDILAKMRHDGRGGFLAIKAGELSSIEDVSNRRCRAD